VILTPGGTVGPCRRTMSCDKVAHNAKIVVTLKETIRPTG